MTQARDSLVAGLGEGHSAPGTQHSALRRTALIIRRNPLGAFGGLLIFALIVGGVFAPLIAPYPIDQFSGPPAQAPTREHVFGTDKFGRDMFSRIVYGARISLQVGFVAVALGTLIGLAIGVSSGYIGGLLDTVVQRTIDTAIAFPQIILLLIIVRLLGPSIRNVIFVVAIGIIPGIARVVRGSVLSERQNQYVEAARALGASDVRIIIRHLTPNILPLAIVIATTLLGTAILAEASLSVLGLGIPPPNPSWGADISASRTSFPINVWSALFPGIAISLTVLGFNLLGDTLRDILDPRLRGSR
ncbi:MAG: ABC transporter permease [Dehalococcoidia bacterium]